MRYYYDTLDRLSKIIIEDNYYYEIVYDNQNRISQVKVNSNALMTYTYEMYGSFYTNRISTQTYGNGDSIKFLYDGNQQLEYVQFKDAVGSYENKFSYEYDQSGRLAVLNSFDKSSIAKSEYYTYDSSNRLIRLTDNAGNSMVYDYDKQGNLIKLSFDINDYEFFVNYTYNKELNFGANNNYNTSSNLYDKTTYTSSNQIDVKKEYNYEGNALYKLDFINLSIGSKLIKQDFTYSGKTSRISSITYDIDNNGVDYKYSYSYDQLNNITEVTYYEGSVLKYKDNYTYDRLNQLIIEDVYSSNNVESYTNYYSYDKHGNITSVKTFNYKESESNIPSSKFIDYSDIPGMFITYNGGSSYTEIYNLQIGETPLLNFEYTENIDGRSFSNVYTSVTSSNINIYQEGYYYNEYTAYSSEGINIIFRIIFKVGNPPLTKTPNEMKTYHYDENWLDKLKSYDIIINNSTLTQNFTYDNQGNPIKITNFIYKEDYKDEAILSWDGQELSKLTIKDNGVIIASIEYKYNDQGYRISKKITEGTSIQTIEYTLSGDKVVYETDGTYRIIYSYDYDGTIISFNYDNNISDSVLGIEYFYIRNQQGDITIIVDRLGKKVAEYRYDAWGNIINERSAWALNVNKYTYRGYRYDAETGLYYLNSRYYNPEIKRFINADGRVGGIGEILELNAFTYSLNNPISNIDPNGYFSFRLIGAIGGAIFGGIVGAVVSYQKTGKVSVGSVLIGAAVGAAVGAGLGYLADKIAAASNALVATESIASLGGGALTTASADGDPTNEIRDIVNVGGQVYKSLESNVNHEGIYRQVNQALHHIVPKGMKGTQAARNVLEKFNININNAMNGIYLDKANHAVMHTTKYVDFVNSTIASHSSSLSNVREGIQVIINEIMSGRFF